MKKFIAAAVILSLIAAFVPAFSASALEKGRKGASERAYERASEEAIFHRIGDWFATRGKSEEEKKAIIAERKAKRAAARLQKQAEKQKRELEKKATKAQKKIRQKTRGRSKKK